MGSRNQFRLAIWITRWFEQRQTPVGRGRSNLEYERGVVDCSTFPRPEKRCASDPTEDTIANVAMSLSYYYEFCAGTNVSARELEQFLQEVRRGALTLGFAPVVVLNIPFDTAERREFSCRLGASLTLKNERLKGVALPAPEIVRDHDPFSGECRIFPEHGVVIVVTDEQQTETCFGFFRFPEYVLDVNGRVLAESPLGTAWWFRNFVDSPNPRFRQIVQRFADSGFLKREKDEFAS